MSVWSYLLYYKMCFRFTAPNPESRSHLSFRVRGNAVDLHNSGDYVTYLLPVHMDTSHHHLWWFKEKKMVLATLTCFLAPR